MKDSQIIIRGLNVLLLIFIIGMDLNDFIVEFYFLLEKYLGMILAIWILIGLLFDSISRVLLGLLVALKYLINKINQYIKRENETSRHSNTQRSQKNSSTQQPLLINILYEGSTWKNIYFLIQRQQGWMILIV